MRISIIVPAFNQGQYLAQTLDSIFAQTIKPHEVIVINDGSQDETQEIASSYPVKLINQVNKGLASARNTGIMNMTGDFFLPLDSDDLLMENAVEKILEVIKFTDADIVAPSFKCFGINNDTVVLMPNPMLEDFKVANRIGYFSAIRRDALLEIGGYSPRMVFGYEDLHLWINLLSRGKRIVTMKDILILYRTKENSMFTDSLKHHYELMGQIYKDFPDFHA